MEKNNIVVLNAISQAIFDKKGANILALDMKPCSLLAEYVIIAEGSVDRHVIALAEQIEKVLGYVDEPELIHRDNLVLL